MRVWILETLPDYEPSTRYGVWARPQGAHVEFIDQVSRLVKDRDRFRAHLEHDRRDPLAPIWLVVSHESDVVRLSGEVVTGGPDDREAELQGLQDLSDLSTLLAAHAADWGFEVEATQSMGTRVAQLRAYKPDLPY